MRRVLVGALLLGACGAKRKPIARGDGGPSVVVTDGRAADLGALPSTPEVEPNDTVATAQPLAGVRIGGVLAVGGTRPDVDLYRIDAPAPAADAPDGGTAWVGTVVVHGGEGALALDVLDAAGKAVLTRIAAPHERAQITNLALDAATVVRVRRVLKKGEADTARDYTIEVSSRLHGADEELEPNDEPAHAGTLGPTTTGVLDPTDRDLFVLPTVPDGSTFRVELAANPDVAPELRLRHGDQVLSTARTGKGGELRLRNVPSGAGLVLQLRVVDGTSDAPYALKVESEPALDALIEHEPNDDRAHANKVALGELAGYLWPGDVDWFCADVAVGARVDAMADVDFALELFDAAGKSLAKANAGKRGSGEAVPADPAARCVKLTSVGRGTAFDAPYRITFTAPE